MPRIEGRRYGQLELQHLRPEHQWHVLRLVVADAMLARQRAADFDDALHQSLTNRFDSCEFARLARVEQEVRMQVAITRMKDVDRRQSGSIRFVVDQLQEFRERPFWDDCILHQEVGTELSHQSARHLARLPKFLAFSLVRAVFDIERTRFGEQLRDRLHPRIHQHRRAFDFCHQQKRIFGETNRHGTVFDHGHKPRVHQFDRHRKRRMSNQRMNRAFGRMQVRISGAERPGFFGTRQQSQPEPRKRTERSF